MPYTNITGLFNGICDAIRAKGGAIGIINHQNIPSAILNISGGGGLGCDIGFIYLDEDPFKPSGGGNGNNANYSGGGGNSGNGGNGGGNYSYGNGGGNNGGEVNYSPLAQMVCSDNVYSLENFYSFHPISMNYYPACGNNVIYMDNAFRMDGYYTNVVGSPVYGPNVLHMNNAYKNCYHLTGTFVASPEYNMYIYGDNCFAGSGMLGCATLGSIDGLEIFRECYFLQGVEISSSVFSASNTCYSCGNLSDVIYRRKPYGYIDSYTNEIVYEDPDINNCFPMNAEDLQYVNYYNCFSNTATYNYQLNIYCYNEYDYNFLKNNFFNNFFNGGPNVSTRTFRNETTPSGTTINCAWNVYDGNGNWNNYNKEMNVIKRCNSYSSSYGAGPYEVVLYYVS